MNVKIFNRNQSTKLLQITKVTQPTMSVLVDFKLLKHKWNMIDNWVLETLIMLRQIGESKTTTFHKKLTLKRLKTSIFKELSNLRTIHFSRIKSAIFGTHHLMTTNQLMAKVNPRTQTFLMNRETKRTCMSTTQSARTIHHW